MYIPKYCEVNDRPKLFEFIKDNSFSSPFSHTGDEPMASHLPFVIDDDGGDQGLIFGHMAKANGQWRNADAHQVLLVLDSPHTYVSPTWYQDVTWCPPGTTWPSTLLARSMDLKTGQVWKRA